MLLTYNGVNLCRKSFCFCHNCVCYYVGFNGGGGGVAHFWTISAFKNNCLCYCVVFNGGIADVLTISAF